MTLTRTLVLTCLVSLVLSGAGLGESPPAPVEDDKPKKASVDEANAESGEQGPKEWTQDFSQFARILSDTITKNKTGVLYRMMRGELKKEADEVLLLSDGGGYVIDLAPQKGFAQFEANRVFAGKRVRWEVEVLEDVDPPYTFSDEVDIRVRVPQQAKNAKRIEFINVELPKQEYLPKAGDRLIISGPLGLPVRSTDTGNMRGVMIVNDVEIVGKKNPAYGPQSPPDPLGTGIWIGMVDGGKYQKIEDDAKSTEPAPSGDSD
jgi:hypothetical protein